MRKLLALVLLTAGLAWAQEPGRGLVLVYNARDDHSVEVELQLVERLKSLRTAGHFDPAKDLSTKFTSVDLNVPAYAATMKQLGVSQVPFLALVTLNKSGQPAKVLWGEKVSDVNASLAALDGKLGLTPAGPERVRFLAADGQQLVGYLWKPSGPGPFPAVLWNHGHFKSHGNQAPPPGEHWLQTMETLAGSFTARGYLFFAPCRHGFQESPEYSQGRIKGESVRLEVQNEDVTAALDCLKKRADVDSGRLAMMGVSAGAIQSVICAEKGLGLKAVVAFSPGGLSWKEDGLLRKLMLTDVTQSRVPIFVLQAANDFDTGPVLALGPALDQKGAPNQHKLYPPFGANHNQAQVGFAQEGYAVWGADVLAFLDQCLKGR